MGFNNFLNNLKKAARIIEDVTINDNNINKQLSREA